MGNIREKCRNTPLCLQNSIVIILVQSVHGATLKLNAFQAALQKSISLEKNCSGKHRLSLSVYLTRIDEKRRTLSSSNENPVPGDKEGLPEGANICEVPGVS